jgi:type II secretory pathway pseudopilin PulG
MARRTRSGFTLIEVFIVLVTFAILVTLAGPQLCGVGRASANRRACRANMRTLAGALEMYHLDTKRRPTALTPEVRGKLTGQGYLQSFPSDPGREGEYQLTAPRGPGADLDSGISCTVHGPTGAFRASLDRIREGHLAEDLERRGAKPELVEWAHRLQGEVEGRLDREKAAPYWNLRIWTALAFLLGAVLAVVPTQTRGTPGHRRAVLVLAAVLALMVAQQVAEGIVGRVAPGPASMAEVISGGSGGSWTGAGPNSTWSLLAHRRLAALAESEEWSPGAVGFFRELEEEVTRIGNLRDHDVRITMASTLAGMLLLLVFWVGLGSPGLEKPEGEESS